MREKIQGLLDSDTTGYRIAQETGVSEAVISKLRNGKRKLDDITLLTAERLSGYNDKQSPERERIQELLNSDTTGYRIAQETGVSEAVISKLRNGKRNLDDITLVTVEKLSGKR